MTTLTIWQFHTSDGAINGERILANLSAQNELPVEDASLVLWPETARSPHTRMVGNLAQLAPLDQSFWGSLYGHLFAAPLLGDSDTDPGYLRALGVDAELARVLRTGMQPGSSVLLAITEHDIASNFVEQIGCAPTPATVFRNRLTAAHADNLHRVFGR